MLTVSRAGDDLTGRVVAERSRLFSEGVDALYVDLPLDQPESAHVSESLEELRLSYSGIFPEQPGRRATSSDCNASATPPR